MVHVGKSTIHWVVGITMLSSTATGMDLCVERILQKSTSSPKWISHHCSAGVIKWDPFWGTSPTSSKCCWYFFGRSSFIVIVHTVFNEGWFGFIFHEPPWIGNLSLWEQSVSLRAGHLWDAEEPSWETEEEVRNGNNPGCWGYIGNLMSGL